MKTLSDVVKQLTAGKCEWRKCWACNEVNENVTLQYVAHVFIFFAALDFVVLQMHIHENLASLDKSYMYPFHL